MLQGLPDSRHLFRLEVVHVLVFCLWQRGPCRHIEGDKPLFHRLLQHCGDQAVILLEEEGIYRRFITARSNPIGWCR
ncbi:hypothetical protein [Pseudoflavonifractor sp. An187]|uniref:hypothetical protein n=1 Tax=Pseudoflavonifractor sp. An187 TaxID=1965578 RepID=UPI001FA822BD|nr:hypothetical protein [Pseudoflavonifractor sp. An187]